MTVSPEETTEPIPQVTELAPGEFLVVVDPTEPSSLVLYVSVDSTRHGPDHASCYFEFLAGMVPYKMSAVHTRALLDSAVSFPDYGPTWWAVSAEVVVDVVCRYDRPMCSGTSVLALNGEAVMILDDSDDGQWAVRSAAPSFTDVPLADRDEFADLVHDLCIVLCDSPQFADFALGLFEHADTDQLRRLDEGRRVIASMADSDVPEIRDSARADLDAIVAKIVALVEQMT